MIRTTRIIALMGPPNEKKADPTLRILFVAHTAMVLAVPGHFERCCQSWSLIPNGPGISIPCQQI